MNVDELPDLRSEGSVPESTGEETSSLRKGLLVKEFADHTILVCSKKRVVDILLPSLVL